MLVVIRNALQPSVQAYSNNPTPEEVGGVITPHVLETLT